MMSRLAQAEQQLKAAQTQLLEKVKKKKHCKYFFIVSTVNNYDVVNYNLSYVKCKTVLVSGLPLL